MDSWESRMAARAAERAVARGADEYLRLKAQPQPSDQPGGWAAFAFDGRGTITVTTDEGRFVLVDGEYRLALDQPATSLAQ